MPELDAPDLVNRIAEALNGVLPDGISARGDAGVLVVTTDSGEEYIPLGANIESNVSTGVPLRKAIEFCS